MKAGSRSKILAVHQYTHVIILRKNIKFIYFGELLPPNNYATFSTLISILNYHKDMGGLIQNM